MNTFVFTDKLFIIPLIPVFIGVIMAFNRWTIAEFSGIIASCFLAVLVTIAVLAVFLRYLFGAPLIWAEEIEIFTLLWTIMLGAVYAKRHNSLLRVDIIFNMLPASVQHFLEIVQEIISIGIFGSMIYYGVGMANQFGNQTMPILNLKLYWLYISLPVGAFGMIVVTLFQLNALIRGKEA